MPFRHVKPGTFDLATVQLLQKAFDDVAARLALSEDDVRRSTLATLLIGLAAQGVRTNLADRVEEMLTRANR